MDVLKGKRILITGASSGVGLATVERMADEGAAMVLIARGAQALEEAAALARERGAVAHAIPTDVTDRAAVNDAVARADELLGGIDVLVSNAGAVAFGHFLEVEPDDFDRTVAVSFTGAANVIRATLPIMRDRGGTIVVVSSMMAQLPLPAFSAYTAAKHALRGLINTLIVEEREQRTGVRFAMVSPGPLDTPIYGRATSATGHQPAKLFDAYHPDEIAKAVVKAIGRPRHEHVVGGESKLMTGLYKVARPLGEIPLVLVDRWYRIGGEPAVSPGALWSENDHARLGDGHPGRRSGDVVALTRNLLTAANRARKLGTQLLRPVPER
ncbi:SDR family NAD(P)-dependent oxidoreductase [Solirubrobacter phytolaccae]|uniref:SDR family NAD(P)-dependent oxidoreductase n=1 Tax=Solirubrobacter phytolaccae TaxID=1404360 RepID=A0A9X3N9H0_9ACTN|nr:SDR family NAD(P)-dependent oxidoreductase [Solirubrobacter phytolaccae]MDA0181934.1 SDR family NAD(P)-dependent oxidoreductase [Solirubrobacter phytolaccae]